jgi:hypothetical protein
MKRSVGCLLFAYIGFAGGCGSAASEDYALPGSEPPTLFSLYGHITDSDRGAMVSGTRAAFVWFPASPGAGVQVSQDLGRPLMTDIFEMRIDVIQAPPPFPAGEGGREAELVFYMDGDGDDQLDVSSFGTPSPDRVVGRAPGSRVVWGSGASMDTSKAGPKKENGAAGLLQGSARLRLVVRDG